MTIEMAETLKENLDEILEIWVSLMKVEKEEHFFHYMSEDVINKTSRQFAELMISGLPEKQEVNPVKLSKFTGEVVRLGWSINFINNAIDNFSKASLELMEKLGIIKESNLRSYLMAFIDWVRPLRGSIVEAYAVEWERKISLQKVALQELSASLIPVFDKISVMPLVGTIDTERAKLIMENLLEGVVKQRAEVVLLDITDVPIVDTMVAHHIIQAADAVRLIGAKCMLVGIRPEIAQTIVTLGIDLTDFTTTSTLRRGMRQALQFTNREIVEVEN